MVSRRRVVVSLVCIVLLLLCVVAVSLVLMMQPPSEEHFLDYTEDNFKVSFISGNLTAAVTHDYPRVVFYHSTDPGSQMFDVGFSRIYLFNDSNADGEFSISETEYVSYLDENHVLWNLTTVEFHEDAVAGECACFRMNATLDLYLGLDNETVAISEWADVVFWFRISERNYTCWNSLGSYVVKGGTDLSLNYTLDIRKGINTTGVVVEQLLQGGGNAYMFLMKQKGNQTDVVDRMVSSRFDERSYGSNFTNEFLSTSLPEQDIAFAKDDGTVKAYYRWDSVPLMYSNGSEQIPLMNNSFFTTGTGMYLHTAYAISNATGTLHQEASLGINESAFTASITDWLKDHAVGVTIFVGSMVAVVVGLVLFMRYRRRSKAEGEEVTKDEAKDSGES